MPWLLIDLALVLLSLAAVAGAGLGAYRAVRQLLRQVGAAGSVLERAAADLSAPPPRRPVG